ncbi:RimJ/RimL family protein N-acetyltransferase, partial [Limnobacter thiooxidans]
KQAVGEQTGQSTKRGCPVEEKESGPQARFFVNHFRNCCVFNVSPAIKDILLQSEKLIENGRRDLAFQLVKTTFQSTESDPDSVRKVDRLVLGRKLAELHPLWWQDLGNSSLCLRRTRASDAAFYKEIFSNEDWARRYNRQKPWRGNLEKALERTGQQSPLQSGSLFWVIERPGGRSIGLASLTSIDQKNQKAELSLGLLDSHSEVETAKALFWIMQFAFQQIQLNRLYVYIYTDNAPVRRVLEKFGFELEGTLRDHFYLPPGQFFDVWVMGLNRADVHNNERIKKLAARWVGWII